jgi:hypothetical protein
MLAAGGWQYQKFLSEQGNVDDIINFCLSKAVLVIS